METPAEEAARLRRCLNDLVGVMALTALWAGEEPSRMVETLLDVLRETLDLAFVYARVNDGDDQPPLQVARVRGASGRLPTARSIGDALDRTLGRAPSAWPSSARVPIGAAEVGVAVVRLGFRGELGVVVAGSRRPDFPAPTERLLLDVAGNQATIGLQQARLVGEQKRRAAALDERVAHRTSELTAANEALNAEAAGRRRAEAAAREAERQSRLIVESIPGMVGLLKPDGAVDVVNPQLLEYFGQTLEELRHWGTNGTVHPEDLPHVAEVFGRSMASGSPYEILQRFRRADGAYRWFENRGFPLRGDAGQVVRWCVLLTDIDERKRAEEALAASERHLRLTVDTMPGLVWSALPDGAADFFNGYYLDYLGLSAEQASGWGWTAAVHPDDLPGLAEVWQRLIAEGAPGEAEARLRRHDGEYRWFLFRTNPLRDDDGRIVRWYGINTDIEDRKQAAATLRRAYDSFADAQRLSHTGNFTADIVADEHVWSEELYRIFEFEAGARITTQAVRELVHPEDLPAFDAGFARSLDGADFDLVFRIVTPAGRVKHVRSLARLVERVAGRPLFIGAIQDVTETKLAEEALTRAKSELAHVARATALGALTASIAHEVNQPLAGVVTNAATCVRMLDADPPNVAGARETARRAVRDGHRAAEVVARLRAMFSKKEVAPELVDLNEVAREVLALTAGELRAHQVVLRSAFADDLPPVVGDRVQLQQVVLNLLLNASEAMSGVTDRARDLTVTSSREPDGRVRLAVRDTGVGVDPERAGKLFDAFYTTKAGGMGIGLSVSRSIVERHGGRLWAEPNEGPGVTFAVSLPGGAGAAEDVAGRADGAGGGPPPRPDGGGHPGDGGDTKVQLADRPPDAHRRPTSAARRERRSAPAGAAAPGLQEQAGGTDSGGSTERTRGSPRPNRRGDKDGGGAVDHRALAGPDWSTSGGGHHAGTRHGPGSAPAKPYRDSTPSTRVGRRRR